ncbi:hypothetical protein L1987_63339 [Smallanthus sonchifolius]|uniref:Uncharacterized protein n=1 Tax=Smallanthus sonchifolius TaxID=185202 RepID=A0ACB9CD11_9ASTR|nr:hypothetical protein L1987_63339 [Smallanthus sonchifolius]
MSHHIYPLSHYLLLLLPLFFIIVLSAEINNSTCPSYTCGNVTIRYPFWKMDTESPTQFCGYEGFEIKCSSNGDQQDIPEITLSDDNYYVQWINYDYKSMLLANYDVSSAVPGPKVCPRVNHNISLGTLPLNLSPFSVNISFHFNCSGCPSFATEIPCLDNNGRKSCLVTSTEETEDWDGYSCSEEVVTAVIDELMKKSPNFQVDFGSVLEKGFELQWGGADDCEKCEKSDGRCGNHSTTGHICFCSDGTISKNECGGTFIITTLKFQF